MSENNSPNAQQLSAEEWERRITEYLEQLRTLVSNDLQGHVTQFTDEQLDTFAAEIQNSRVITVQSLMTTTSRLGALLEFWSAAEHAIESVRIARRNMANATARHGVN